jgi:2',3'-cyclic-nucleotide 2'-phosphodiesterase (5'-nucleotidase family)
MKHIVLSLKWLLFLLFVTSCKTVYQPKTLQYADYRITPASPQSETLAKFLQPYADSVNKSMNDVIAIAAVSLEKKQPEGSLGNMMADAMLAKARDVYQVKVDAATANNGGIRINQLPAGNITRGKIFELMPFDNIIVLVQLNGKLLQQLLDHIAGRGGWPLAGITMQIKDKKAVGVLVGGVPLSEAIIYTIALPDYIANGGDDCTMLRAIPQQNKGYLLRDAILGYLSDMSNNGKVIGGSGESRVTLVN